VDVLAKAGIRASMWTHSTRYSLVRGESDKRCKRR
jgi:hypothetical protein